MNKPNTTCVVSVNIEHQRFGDRFMNIHCTEFIPYLIILEPKWVLICCSIQRTNCYIQQKYIQFFLLLQLKAFFIKIEIMSTFSLLVFIKNIVQTNVVLYGESCTATITKLWKCLSLSGNLIRGILQLKLSIWSVLLLLYNTSAVTWSIFL